MPAAADRAPLAAGGAAATSRCPPIRWLWCAAKQAVADYAGFNLLQANAKVVGVDEAAEGKGCVLSMKTTKAENAGK